MNRTPHPIEDFLTPEIVSFMKAIREAKMNDKMVIFTGPGSNGKSMFYELFKRFYKCYVLDIMYDMFSNTYCVANLAHLNVDNPDKDYDFFLVYELEMLTNLKKYRDVYKIIEKYNTSVIIMNNQNESLTAIPNNVLSQVRVINFNNIYVDQVQLNNIKQTDNYNYKLARSWDEIINDNSVRLFKELVANLIASDDLLK